MSENAATLLKGQKALVTGADSGIGAAVARALAQAGAAVGVNYRSGDDADSLVSEIRSKDGEAIALKADVSRESEVKSLFDEFVTSFGRIDILVANAGIQKDARTHHSPMCSSTSGSRFWISI